MNDLLLFDLKQNTKRRRRTRSSSSRTKVKETPKGSNLTFKCSRSGPCVSCLYSEKNEDKYRCSETGYHIPLKCLEIQGGSKLRHDKKPQKERSTMETTHAETSAVLQDERELITAVGHRRLLDDSSASEGEKQAYITYRSCIPAVFEEKLSVLGFELCAHITIFF
ncbi:Structural polyprotein [Thalictrum thalictroides]|uniref:Structural polyprotein n=1 Tax=Thalictrum thalictroides TaxID=46969 RepID=A0A7J6UZC8_THATH|nr:Structural polyprotein [Thalictrum thalictroides]